LAGKSADGFFRLMKILLVATKPPWPLIDGGRVLLWHTMAGLVRHGAEITLVAPLDAASDGDTVRRELRPLCRPELVRHPQGTRVKAFAHALWGGAPVSIALHRFAAMRERVAALLAAEAFDLVHAEQLQAAANCEAVDLLPRSTTPPCCDRKTWRAICGTGWLPGGGRYARLSSMRRGGSARGKRRRCGARA